MAGGTLTIAGGLFAVGALNGASSDAPAVVNASAGAADSQLSAPPAAPIDPTSTPIPGDAPTGTPNDAPDVTGAGTPVTVILTQPQPGEAPSDSPPPASPTDPPATATQTPPTPVPPTRVPPTAVPAQAPPAASVALQPMEQAMFSGHNLERNNAGLAPLTIDARLVEVARRRAQDMASKNYFSHTSPAGETAFTLLDQVGYAYQLAGENIARNNYPDTETVQVSMTGFMNSASHRGNILEQRYRRVGIGLALGADGMKYFAVVFSN